VGLIARGLELKGIATVVISWKAGIIRAIKPPRALLASTSRGETMGPPGDPSRQKKILKSALMLFEKDIFQEPILWSEE